MTRPYISSCIAIVAGIAAVFLLPPPWLIPVATVSASCCAIFAIIVRLGTKTEPPANPMAEVVLSVANLPEQPLAKAKEGWALNAFIASAAFLVSLGLSIIVRASL